MTGDQPVPQPAELAIELERPRAKERDEHADRDGVDRGDVVRLEAENEGPRDQPKAAVEVQVFDAQVIAPEAEMRGHGESKAANGRVSGGDVQGGIDGAPLR